LSGKYLKKKIKFYREREREREKDIHVLKVFDVFSKWMLIFLLNPPCDEDFYITKNKNIIEKKNEFKLPISFVVFFL
jgi:hypothetical protein